MMDDSTMNDKVELLKSLNWDDFLRYLEFQEGLGNLEPHQLESVDYMKAYAGYYRRIKNTIPRALLVCYINTFQGLKRPVNTPKGGVKK